MDKQRVDEEKFGSNGYEDYYNQINIYRNETNYKDLCNTDSLIKPNAHDEYLAIKQGAMLGHILPQTEDIIIANNMLVVFKKNLKYYQNNVEVNNSINYIAFICNIIESLFQEAKTSSKERLTLGVYKRFYNITLDMLNSRGITIARSQVYPKITIIHKEASDKVEEFNSSKFLKKIFNNTT